MWISGSVSSKCLNDVWAGQAGAAILMGWSPGLHSAVIRWRAVAQAILVLAKYFEYVLNGNNQLYLNCLCIKLAGEQ